MKQRIQFIIDVLDGTYSMSELCEAYSISRETGCKWLGRYQPDNPVTLQDRSRAPHSHPQEISAAVKQAVLAIGTRFSNWGALQIRTRLIREHPDCDHYPAVSILGLFLRNQGLNQPRRRFRPMRRRILGGLTISDDGGLDELPEFFSS
jgi:transposase